MDRINNHAVQLVTHWSDQ